MKIEVSHETARRGILDGDLLLFRRRHWWTLPIAVAGRSEYTHTAMAGWWHGRLMCVEMTAGGGRARPLSRRIKKWPGRIDVFGFSPEIEAVRVGLEDHYSIEHLAAVIRAAALEKMIDIIDCDYGWLNLACVAILHLPLLRFLVSPDTEDGGESSRPPFCSQAVAAAYRAAGVDVVPNLADRLTEPADLARSGLFQYRFTLV